MKTRSLLSAISILLMVAGCTTSFRPWLLSEIHENMSRAQVIDVLGEPDSSVLVKGTNYLYYSYIENTTPGSFTSQVDVDFSQRAEQFGRSMKEYSYEVRLVNDNVVGYRELSD